MNSIVLDELKSHGPFTLAGAVAGAALMVVVALARVPREALEPVFEGCHAIHLLLSAMVTSAMFRRYGKGLALGIVVGYVGAVGIGTLSDIVFPYLGGVLIGGKMHLHLAFIEDWWLINPAALLGVAVGLSRPMTRLPHTGHVLLSTWASLFYLMAHGEGPWLPVLPLVVVVLFVAVWLPCCISDIVFPLLFVDKTARREAHANAHGHTAD